MATKADLQRLIDELPDELVDEAARWLEELGNPLLRALLTAPAGSEPDEEPAVTLYRPVG